MKIKNIKVRTQLLICFTIILLLIIIRGLVSYFQNEQLHEQTRIMYDHPLTVQNAMGELKTEIISLHRDMKDLSLTSNETEIKVEEDWIIWWKSEAQRHIDTLYEHYLGPIEDINSIQGAFNSLISQCEETIALLHDNKNEEVYKRTKTFGIIGAKVEYLIDRIEIVNIYSMEKGNQLFSNSQMIYKSVIKELIIQVLALLLFLVLLFYFLYRNIRSPLQIITNAAKSFLGGDHSARSSFESKNEFGILSASFNNLAENVQMNIELNENSAHIKRVMLKENDAREFFRTVISEVAMRTGAQMAAIYIKDQERNTFDLFESIGMETSVVQSFSGETNEGEFGLALTTRKTQHIKNIPENTRFLFHTVTGKFIPREIICIPLLASDKIIAIVSLASISSFNELAISLIDNILGSLSARVDGVLSYRRILDILKRLEEQNRELDIQKRELESKSAELTEQNTELEFQKKHLDEASRLKTTFLSNMSHELRTPLNSVIALTSVLNRRLEGKIPEEEHSYLDVIERNGKHLLSLINDVLDISRIEAGKEDVNIQRFDARDIIAEVVNIILPQAEQKDNELIYVRGDSELIIDSDSDKLNHILMNLVSNAVKFTEKGKVEINSHLTINSIEIIISDTGIGIPPEHLPYIFDEFRQADGSTSRKFGGSGLGLSIAGKYAKLLGGHISVKSTEGKGSEFKLVLPQQYRETDNEELIDSNTEDGPLNVQSLSDYRDDNSFKTILLVEDSEPAIIQITDILEEEGFRVLVARNGTEALKTMDELRPDALILDLMMPEMDGFELLSKIRRIPKVALIPVLILTAKQISREEFAFLKNNHIYQLIRKGAVNRLELLNAVAGMVFTQTVKRKKTHKQAGPGIEPYTILVVEDNADNMTTLRAILADTYNVIEAMDGGQSIELALKHKPDLIIMDIALPEIDGIEAFHSIRKEPLLEHIPVIALTASAMTGERENILGHGFDAYLSKPISSENLINTINQLMHEK